VRIVAVARPVSQLAVPSAHWPVMRHVRHGKLAAECWKCAVKFGNMLLRTLTSIKEPLNCALVRASHEALALRLMRLT
jgi:hypothetical protein